MSKKKIKATDEQPNKYPDWYWHYGLHDAKILSVSEMQLFPDYKSKEQKYNLFEITLDSSATYEQDVKIIRLYNYKIRTPDMDINSTEKPWWMDDTVEVLDDGRYLLSIEFETADGDRKYFSIEFESADVVRKKSFFSFFRKK